MATTTAIGDEPAVLLNARTANFDPEQASGPGCKTHMPLPQARQWNAPSPLAPQIIAGFFAELGRCQSDRSQSPVGSLRRPSPTRNEATSPVRNITSLPDRP